MCVLIFCTSFVWNISHSKKCWVIYDKICIGLRVKYLLFCHSLMKLEFSGQIFDKYSYAKYHESPPIDSRVVACGQTDRHDEAITRFSQFCQRA